MCMCNAGYYGNGVTCIACRTCPTSATLVTACPANSATDTSTCACNAGYYGNGTACTACQTCPANATLATACPANSATDTSSCRCDPGAYGSGQSCAPCPAGAYCTGGPTAPLPCPAHTWSAPGSSSQLGCLCGSGFACSNTKVLRAVVTLNCSAEDFANDVNGVRTSMIRAIANASHVDPSQVSIQGFAPRARALHRPSLAGGLEVSVAVHGATQILLYAPQACAHILALRWHVAHSVRVAERVEARASTA